jgi:acyl-CoA thioesterase
MSQTETVPELLQLEKVGDHRYQVHHERDASTDRDVVFGGQILGQMIMASNAEHGDDREVKSIHAIFARAGTYSQPMELEVDSMHAGRTMGSDTITAWQGTRLVARGMLLLHIDEPDLLRHALEMPDVAGPEDAVPTGREIVFPGTETRIVGGVDTWDPNHAVGPAEEFVWIRFPQSFPSVAVNQAIVAWATDGWLIGTSMLPYAGMSESNAHRTISTGVIAHTLNFHERFDVSDWLLLAHESVYAGRGRTHGRATIYTRDGRLVATYTQDNMVRHFGDGKTHEGEARRIM